MKTNNETKAREIADNVAQETDYKSTAAYEAAMQMAEAKDRQVAEIIKAKAYKMYALSHGGGSYDDRADALTLYGFLADFYHDLTGESL